MSNIKETDINQKLRAMLDKSRADLKFNPHKVKLRVPDVNYDGCILSSEGLIPDPEKIRAINQTPASTDKEGVLLILGTINYLHKFIELKANLQEPISQPNQKDATFFWEKPHQKAFNRCFD